MDMLSIISALAISLLLILIFLLPQKPKFAICERFSSAYTEHRMRELYKRCAKCERGNGIRYAPTFKKIGRVLADIKVATADGERLEAWMIRLLNNSDAIIKTMNEIKPCLRKSYRLGHIDGLPRIFVICDEFVKMTDGCYTKQLLHRITDFILNAPNIEESEIRSFNFMLKFCLLAHLTEHAAHALICYNEYKRGVADGKKDFVDIDSVCDRDYVCGLLSEDASGGHGLLDYNGISADEATESRREYLAITAATVDRYCAALRNIESTEAVEISAEETCEYCEPTFFGGEAEYKCNARGGRYVRLSTDNRGNVKTRFYKRGMNCDIGISCDTPDGVIGLCECDGAFQNHRTVYRSINDGVELSLRLTNPPDQEACLGLIGIINRTHETIKCRLSAYCKLPNEYGCKVFKNCIAASGKDGIAVGLRADCPSRFGAISDNDATIIKADFELDIEPFEESFAAIAAMCGDVSSLQNRLMCVDGAFYYYAERSSRYYFDAVKSESALYGSAISENMFYGGKPLPSPKFDDVSLPDSDYAIKTSVGGLTEKGYAVNLREASPSTLWHNILTDGEVYSDITHDGNSVDRIGNESVAGSALPGIPNIVIALEESGYVWSPCGKSAGACSEFIFNHGFCEFSSGSNGCISSLKRYIARGKRAEIFDITIENRVDAERNIDIMMSVSASEGYEVHRQNDDVYCVNRANKGFVLMSSRPIDDFTQYAEGFISHGKIVRAARFERGGIVVAPTVSVSAKIAPFGSFRAVFCIAAYDGGCELENITLAIADNCFAAELEFYDRLKHIVLDSSDRTLNYLYETSLFSAYKNFMRVGNDNLVSLSECFSVKYADPDIVKRKILEMCGLQDISGRLHSQIDTVGSTLLLPLAVNDIVKFTGDRSFYDETVEFMSIGELKPQKATLLEHCLRAIDNIAIFLSAYIDREKSIRFGNFCLLNLAVKSFMEHADRARRKLYSAAAFNARYAVMKERAEIYHNASDTALSAVSAAIGMFDRNSEQAYGLLSATINRLFYGAEPELFTSFDGMTASAFYLAVTEKLLGISIAGDNARVMPQTSQVSPHIEFDVRFGEKPTHIVIDDSQFTGYWQMNIDRITYASDKIKLSEGNDFPIVFKRYDSAC